MTPVPPQPGQTPRPGTTDRPTLLRLVNTTVDRPHLSRDLGRQSPRSATPPQVRPAPGGTSWSARAAVTAENLAAANFAAGTGGGGPGTGAGVGNTDPRWLLAVKTSSLLEGGRAALLRPDRRKIVLDLAHHMGLRPFDANLVIAVVQDSARAGEGALSGEVRGRLGLVGGVGLDGVGDPERPVRREPTSIAGPLIAALAMGAMLAWVLVDWVLGR